MDACSGFFVLLVIICLISGGIKLYVMCNHPELYANWKRAELMEEQRKAVRDARFGNAAKTGLWLTRFWLGK